MQGADGFALVHRESAGESVRFGEARWREQRQGAVRIIVFPRWLRVACRVLGAAGIALTLAMLAIDGGRPNVCRSAPGRWASSHWPRAACCCWE
jgi:hypothetical protein